MLTVETIGRIRRAYFIDGKPIRQIVRELRVSRKTVRKAVPRRRAQPAGPPAATADPAAGGDPPVRLALALEPAADCGRYDALRQRTAAGGR